MLANSAANPIVNARPNGTGQPNERASSLFSWGLKRHRIDIEL